ncbi:MULTISPECIES: hypothetical protein [Nostocales]|uniref:hypothetical protein n=1 Tax=Nostocales TaxID=1161 RepID=UPI001688BEFF|nr:MULTISPECIES: hypothetical protein [Nostocales]MBD2302574.1 hypothetical protein [Nostoc sp. FACHB-190]MBD2492227.1 hypothetical protein [Aulosira sp. FACHB-615]
MEATISIPQGWQYPRFAFGQRTERGQIIGMKYYAQNTFLADEYGAGWRYVLLPNKNTEDEQTRLEDEIKLLSPEELKAVLEAEISNHLRQVKLLKHELKAVGMSVVSTESTTQTQANNQIEHQSSISPPELHKLIDAAKFVIREIAKHSDFQQLDYHPDLTIGDAQSALSYLQMELELKQQPASIENRSIDIIPSAESA